MCQNKSNQVFVRLRWTIKCVRIKELGVCEAKMDYKVCFRKKELGVCEAKMDYQVCQNKSNQVFVRLRWTIKCVSE